MWDRLPDPWLRLALRRGLRAALVPHSKDTEQGRQAALDAIALRLRSGPIWPPALPTRGPSDLPGSFLGPHGLLAACFWLSGSSDLPAAEEAMLGRIADKAGIEDGMAVLTLEPSAGGLGPGIARAFPAGRIDALALLAGGAEQLSGADRPANLSFLAGRLEDLPEERRYDRIVVQEVLERSPNWEGFLGHLARRLKPEGRVLVQHVCHRRWAWFVGQPWRWADRHFLPGAVMPTDDLLRRFERHLVAERRDHLSGEHYERTARAWLANLAALKGPLTQEAGTHANRSQRADLRRWRVFLLALCEVFGFRRGQEWWVTQVLLRPAGSSPA